MQAAHTGALSAACAKGMGLLPEAGLLAHLWEEKKPHLAVVFNALNLNLNPVVC